MDSESAPLADPAVRATLADWLSNGLRRTIEAASLTARTPSSGGWSNDTWLVAVEGTATAVVRLQPERSAMFPRYDLGRQVRCLELVSRKTAAPVPALLGVDLEGDRLGRPAFVMDHIHGRVPSDDTPTFAESGWLVDAPSSDQRRFHEALLDNLAEIHTLGIDDPDVVALDVGPDEATTNHALLADLRATWEFDRGDRWPEAIEAGFACAADGIPQPTADVLLWGDARPANVVVAAGDFVPVALLDWELAAVGDPEHDVAWLAEMNWMRIEGAGLRPPPGFLTDDEAWAHYERVGGRSLSGERWYREFAALRVAVLMHRYLRTLVHAGRLPADHHILADNVASRRLVSIATNRIG